MQLCRVYARDPHRQTRIGVRGNSVWFHGTLFREVSSVSPRVPSSLHQPSASTRVSFRLCTAVNIRTFVDRVDIYLSACTRMHVVTFVRQWNRTTRTPHLRRKTLFAFAIRERAPTQAISGKSPGLLGHSPVSKGIHRKRNAKSRNRYAARTIEHPFANFYKAIALANKVSRAPARTNRDLLLGIRTAADGSHSKP